MKAYTITVEIRGTDQDSHESWLVPGAPLSLVQAVATAQIHRLYAPEPAALLDRAVYVLREYTAQRQGDRIIALSPTPSQQWEIQIGRDTKGDIVKVEPTMNYLLLANRPFRPLLRLRTLVRYLCDRLIWKLRGKKRAT